MTGIVYSFEKLKVWQEAKKLVVDVYHLLDGFPKFEKFALCDQIRRAIVSVPSNIAEGMGRFSNKERVHFLEIANGSLMEVMCQLEVSLLLGYISQQQFDEQELLISDMTKMLYGLRKTFDN